MVTYIRSDLDFILAQIKIAEAHAAGQPLYGPGGQIPSYNIAWGLRTVDGSFNHLLPGQERWGASDREFVELMDPNYRPADGTPFDPDGPGPAPAMPTSPNYNPSNNPNSLVFDSSLRTISNLLVDQSLGNPAAILTGLQNAGVADPGMVITGQISAAYAPLKPLFKALAEAERAEASAAAAAAANPGNAALQQAAEDAAADLAAAQSAVDAGAGPVASGGTGLYDLLALHGIELDGTNVHIPNTAPDEGLSAPFNSWFTLFGQFFDHGLDLVNKGGSGTVFVPLQPDDPLWDPTPGAPNFMVLTRATVTAGPDNMMGTADDVRPMNTTTAFVDQNQTYSSHASHQVFLRQYVATANGPVATGHLIEGANGGMATWGEVKAQAAALLGIQLTDLDVGRVPLLRTDPYGNFIAGSNGYPLVITGVGVDGIPNTADDVVIQGDPTANGGLGISIVSAIRTSAAFLADIAHTAVPEGLADGDTEIGGNIPEDGTYDDELLNAHFIAGDGRANENIGLTAVHHVFHAEHNRLVEHTKAIVLATGDAAFIAEWRNPDGSWNGERLFQAAKFGTEMQYQHLVFEEFARKVQPTINTFLVPDGFDTMMDPSIFAEFAHVVYRFGHSMLTESIDQFGPTFQPDHISLIQGFLNPTAFTSVNGVDDGIAAGAIIRGMTRQVGNEIDEFVTGALRNNLLGLPLDLATINLARGRDTGVPALNEARRTFYEATNQDARLKPYESWIDYAGHLKHEASIINFIAAYGTHQLITGQTTIEGKRDAALTIITGVSVGGFLVPADAEAFLNGTGAYAEDLGGLENVDLWIGGLAEEVMPFGGMLGATFNFVFEQQMELLQSGDRFYYLQRLDGLHLFGEMENNSFAAMIMRNTDATHLPSDVFSTPGLILEVDQTKQFNDSNGDGVLDSLDPVGPGLLTQLVVRNSPNNLRYNGDEHVVLGGTETANVLIAGIGDDTLFGDGGNDRLEGGFGNDILNGGAGDDIIVDSGGDDNIKAGDGNDVVHAGPGLDLVMGGAGQDFVFLGTDEGSEVFAGEGDDFIYGNRNAERILGNEGNDWIETGTFDGAPGDNFDEIFSHDGVNGHDVFLGDGGFDEFIGEGGDDIMVGSTGRGKMVGMSGFDWATYKDSAVGTTGVNADLSIPIVFDEAPVIPANAALDEYQSMEGLSGSAGNDILRGSNILADERLPFHPVTNPTPLEGYRGSALNAAGIALISGLQDVLGAGVTSFSAGDIILGGDGSDIITGQMGDDIIDGDKWLDVQIGVFAPGDTNHTGTPSELHNSMTTLASRMFSGELNPGQLSIVRTIRTDATAGDTDVAVFSDIQANYTITSNPDGTISVAHTIVSDGLESDGTDRIRNIEILRFSDGDLVLGAPQLLLHTSDPGQYLDQFDAQAYNNSNGTTPWTTSWMETGDLTTGNLVTGGQIRIAGNELVFRDDDNDAGAGGATIQRPVDLAGATSASVSYSYDESSFDAGETVTVVFSRDGTALQTLQTLNNNSGTGTNTVSLTGPFTANAFIRFVVAGTNNNSGGGDNIAINNLAINFVRPIATPTEDYETTFTEGGAAVAIASGPSITDSDDTQMASARIVLTNAQLDDEFVIGALPAGITSSIDLSVSGQLIVNLTGNASLAAYQAAIQAVSFRNVSATPITDDRIINVTVNDGLLSSAPATTTVNVTAVNNAPIANIDNVITNAVNEGFVVPEWVMLANDEDPEGGVLNVTGATENDGSFSIVVGETGDVTATSTNTGNHDFTYTVSDGTATDTADVDIVWDTAGEMTGNANANILIGNSAGTTFNGAGGDDIILAGAGIDTITQVGATGGRDFVDGGLGVDTYQLNGAAGAETFVIYSRAAAEAAFVGIVLNTLTEIVITRNGSVIAELNDIEEIRVNTLLVTSPPGTGGSNGGDTIQVSGDFTGTSLNFNTITIDGNAGDDTVDISALTSAHRIVFRSNGGNDTIVGTLRPQDVIELPDGATADDYEIETDENGVTTMTSGTHSLCFTSQDGLPQFSSDHDDEDDDHDDDDDDCGCDDDDDDAGTPAPTPTGGSNVRVGTASGDVLLGTSGDDNIIGLAGDDVLVGEAGNDAISGGDGADFVEGGAGRDTVHSGAGDDHVFAGAGTDLVNGEAGADRLFGQGGNDVIKAGAGDDAAFGGAGDDLFIGEVGDGNDAYYGDEIDGGNGVDTLDLSAISANLTVDLGNGMLGRGSAVSSQSGSDTLWHIENVATGSGNDTITASRAVNVMEGGAGDDVFRFSDVESADGDTIIDFQPGDRLDLSGIDANGAVAGNQNFTLVNGPAFNAAAQLMVSYEEREGVAYTIVSGNVGGSAEEEFRIELKGSHNLTGSNFIL